MPHFYGAVGAPNVGHHRWQPYSRRPLFRGTAHLGGGGRLFVYETRVLLHDIRSRRDPPEYGLRIAAGVLTALVHLLALVLLVMVRPPGYPPPAGNPQEASIDVRLIPKTQKPPPPPPPIKLPRRKHHVRKAPRHVPPTIKRARVAAMPPIPQAAPTRPEIKLKTVKPKLAKVQPKTQPLQRAATSPPVTKPTTQVEMSPAPPKVVMEKSSMAIAPPPVDAVQVAPAKVSSPDLQPVPTQATAPRVTLGNPDLARVQAGAAQGVTQPSVHAEAATPQVPQTDLAPDVRITATPTRPNVAVQTPTPESPSMPTVEVAPVPQAPKTATPAPALDLPVANVPEPQAPATPLPSVHVKSSPASTAKSATASPSSSPSSSASSAKSRAEQVARSKSWAPANDQFKPLSGKQGNSSAAPGGGEKHPQGYVQLMPRGNSDVMHRNSDHLGYKSTIFDQYWAPENESILDTFLRRLVEKLTVTHTFHVAPGVRVHCALGPMAVFLACGGDPPRKGSSKSNDPRLNMAPARSLVPGMHTPASASTAPPVQLNNQAQCDAARVAGSPPPPGCPGAPIKPSQSDQWNPPGGGG